MFSLPQNIIRIIYQYDSTYHDKFNEVLRHLMRNYHTWHDWYKYVERREKIRMLEYKLG